MDNESRKSVKIWLYLLPVFALAAWPALKWAHKAGSGDVPLTKEDYGVFNAEQGEISRPPRTNLPRPDLAEQGFRVHYRNAGEQAAAEELARREAEAREKIAAAKAKAEAERPRAAVVGAEEFAPDAARVNEQKSMGLTRGYLSYAMEKIINNPKAVAALLNNQYVINGFMSRDSVKNATASPEALAKFLGSGSVIGNFMNNAAVQAALNNPAALNAAAGSDFLQAMLNTPAGQALAANPQAMADIIAANPQLQGLLGDPKLMALLMGNPDAAAYLTQMNSGKK